MQVLIKSYYCIFRGGQCSGDEKRSMILKNEMPLFSGQETNGKLYVYVCNKIISLRILTKLE